MSKGKRLCERSCVEDIKAMKSTAASLVLFVSSGEDFICYLKPR